MPSTKVYLPKRRVTVHPKNHIHNGALKNNRTAFCLHDADRPFPPASIAYPWKKVYGQKEIDKLLADFLGGSGWIRTSELTDNILTTNIYFLLVYFSASIFTQKSLAALENQELQDLVGAGGFEPPKSLTTDLQSAPFGHSGTLPYLLSR